LLPADGGTRSLPVDDPDGNPVEVLKA